MQIHNVEQGTDDWFKTRAGRPTASEFKKVYTSTGKNSTQINDYAATLAAELYADEPLEKWEGNQWTERGKDLEDEAQAMYELTTGNKITPVGFITNGDIGASPDGLICDKSGGLEMKCLSPAKHVQALAYVDKHDKPPSDFVVQMQGQILVAELLWVDLWLYHPVLPSRRIRLERDEEFLSGLSKALDGLLVKRDAMLSVLNKVAA